MNALRRLREWGAFSDRWIPLGVLGGLLAMAIYTSAQVAIPLVTGSIVDEALLAEDRRALWTRVLLLVGAALVSTVCRGLFRTTFTWLGERSRAYLQSCLLARFYGLPLASFDRDRTGRLHSLLIEEAAKATRQTSRTASEGAVGVFQLGLLLLVLALEYDHAVFAAAVLIPLYMIFPLIFNRPVRQASRRAFAATGEVHAALQESVQGVREVKIFGREDWSVQRVRDLLAEEVGHRLRLVVLDSILGFQYAVYFLVAGAVYWFGGLRVLEGNLSVGELIALVSLLAYLEGPVSRLARLGTDFQQVNAAVERIEETLRSPRDELGQGTGSLELGSGPHRIELDQVTFAYEGSDRPALFDVSFQIEPGEKVALVGPSGAGKSTLVHLLARLYDPQEGQIRIDGRSLTEYRLESLRQEVGFVLQDALLFSGTVKENLRLGRLDASDEDLRRCARLANADEFVQALPQGYDTEVGERAVKLSGGQRQRIGIARVLLRNPGVLILDEAMSSLDTESERLVQEALERLMVGRTTLSIAHRLSSFIRAERILVMERGRIVAQGGHTELLATSDPYRRLVGGVEDPIPERNVE